MLKCEVLDNCVIAIGKGSIVYVSERQYELARKLLKPVKEAKTEKVEVKTEKVEEVETPKKETRKRKK